MGKLTDDVLKWTLDIDGNPARKELTDVSNSTNKLERDNRALFTEMAKLEAHGKKGSEEWKKYESQIKANDTAIAGNKKRMEELRKEVGLNNLSSAELRKEMKNLKIQMDRMDPNSKQWKDMNSEFGAMQGRLSQIRGGVTSVDGVFGKFKQTAGALLPAFGFAAIAAGAKATFDKVISSTDFLSTKWEIFIGGMKSGTDEFFRIIATGDWSNFLSNMGEAVRVGREYANTMDRIEEKTRALRITEADSRAEELELEEKLKNKGLSKEERLKAGQERIKLEEDLSQKRVKVAQDAFDAELSVTMQQTRLSKDRLMEVVSDMDSETKAKAQAYNDQLDIYQSAVKKNEQAKIGLSRAGISDNPFAKEMENSKVLLDSYPDSVKVYAEALRGVGNTTDEQLNKMVSAYEGLISAQNSAAENTKKVRTTVNSLLAGKEDDGSKVEDQTATQRNEAAENAIKAIELAYMEQQTFLASQYEGQEDLQKEYHARMLANELAFILAKQKLATDDKTYLELQQQYIQKQNNYAEAVKQLAIPIMKSSEEISNFNNRLLEQSKLLDFAAQKQKQGAAAQDEYTAKQQQQTDAIKMVGDVMTDYMSGALNGTLDEYQTFGDTLILMSLQVLKSLVPIWSAQILGYSLADPISVATVGVKGMINYAAVMTLLYTGISGVEGMVKSGMDKRREAAGSKKGYATGGYAYEEQYVVSEKNKPEWIAPNWMLRDATTGPVINWMERVRTNRLNIPTVAFSQSDYKSRENNVTSTRMQYDDRIIGILARVEHALESNTEASNRSVNASGLLIKNGVQFPIVTFKKQYEEISDLLNQTGMGGFKK